MIKQNIKMRVTPEQSKRVQEICFKNGICWIVGRNIIQYENKKYLYLSDKYITFGDTYEYFEEHDVKEIDADLFIRTNGTCEEESTLNDDDITRILKASEGQPREYLKQKIINLHDQLNKNRKTVQNQKEELTRLLNQKKQLNNRLDIYALYNDNQKIKITNLLSQKEDLQNQLNMANKKGGISINNGIDLVKLLEEKDGIIKYLERKLEI